ncbi:MAG: response regulator transcription factor [Verrucomicrobiales bacterium]
MSKPEPKERILIVEDELPMRTALADTLADQGYRPLTAADGESGLQRALEEQPDLILLDVMMPGRSGYSVATELRRLGQSTPILMLTAKGQIEDRVDGLDSGADDYLIKPFSTRELLARVRALLRRNHPESAAAETLRLGDCTIDFTRQTAERAGDPMPLTAKEFAVLKLLAEREGEPVSRDEFLDIVWGYAAFPTTRTVDNHIASLRTKLDTDKIKTVHRVGYKLII